MPPRLRSLGIPPAKSPPSWGAVAGAGAPPSEDVLPPSLLLRSRLAEGGARPLGAEGLTNPGTGGAAPIVVALDFFSLPIAGADRSFVTVFFKFVPCLISLNSAPYT
jgi:hypothetical protein